MVATVTVVHHEQESILSKQRIEAIIRLWGKQNLNTKQLLLLQRLFTSRATIHHAACSGSKLLLYLGSKTKPEHQTARLHCNGCSSRARIHPVETKDRGYYCTWGLNGNLIIQMYGCYCNGCSSRAKNPSVETKDRGYCTWGLNETWSSKWLLL